MCRSKILATGDGFYSEVLSGDVTSHLNLLVGIDKLDFSLDINLNENEIRERVQNAKEISISERKQLWKSPDKHGVEVRDLGSGASVKMTTTKKTGRIWRIYTNPSKFKNFETYLMFLLSFFRFEELMSSKIFRLDYSVDIKLSLYDIMCGLNIKHKKKMKLHIAENGQNTGYYFGENHHQIIVYDKVAELLQKKKKVHVGDTPLTRIEVRFKGGKKLSGSFRGYLKSIRTWDESQYDYFSQVELNELKIDPLEKIYDEKSKTMLKNIKEVQQSTILKTAIYCTGFSIAKKKLDTNRNFQRDYGPYFNLAPLPLNLNKALSDHIADFSDSWKASMKFKTNLDEYDRQQQDKK